MKKVSIFNRVVLVLALAVGFASCSKDDGGIEPPKENQFLKEVTVERKIAKADIIAGLDKAFPELHISTSPIALMIKDVDVAAITYTTTGVDGKPTTASGVVAMVSGTAEYDHLLSIQHSTLDMEEAPSRQLFYAEMAPVVGNHIVVMADYLGYGASQTADRQHPYLHHQSTGVVCADMIEAAREYLASKRIKEKDDKIELMGYSQGANSTISTVYEMEKRGQGSRIRAVHAGGGAYDLKGTIVSLATPSASAYPRLGYLPYLVRGMSYGEQIKLDDAKIYSPALIAQGGITMFNTKPLSQWHEPLGSNVLAILNPDFFAIPTFNGNTDIIKLFGAIEKNSLINLDAAKTQVKLYHSQTDDFIPYSNSTAAKNKWSNATLTDLTSDGHIKAGAEFMLRYMGIWDMLNK